MMLQSVFRKYKLPVSNATRIVNWKYYGSAQIRCFGISDTMWQMANSSINRSKGSVIELISVLPIFRVS